MTFDVALTLDDCILKCQIINIRRDDNTVDIREYAFYLLKDDIQIETIWYSNELTAEFILKEAGNYSVIGFMKCDDIINSVQTEKRYIQNPNLKVKQCDSTRKCFNWMNYSKFSSMISCAKDFLCKDINHQITVGENKCSDGVAIFGSCVTRDLFDFAETDICAVNSYVARQSIISAVSNPVKVNMKNIKLGSDFLKRCVYYDLNKVEHWKFLKYSNGECVNKYIILDLIDERFDLIKIRHSLITYSSELMESRYFSENQIKLVRKVKAMDGTWYIGDICISECVEQFALTVRKFFYEDNIIIHKVKMADNFIDSNGIINEFSEEIVKENHRINEMLEFMYSCLIQSLPKAFVIDLSSNYLADSSHKWGLAPMHFQKEYYIEVNTFLGKVLCFENKIV